MGGQPIRGRASARRCRAGAYRVAIRAGDRLVVHDVEGASTDRPTDEPFPGPALIQIRPSLKAETYTEDDSGSQEVIVVTSVPTYPVQLDLETPLRIARWRPLVHWLLAIPQLLVLYFLGIAIGILTFLAWFAILFTARIPPGMFDFMVMIHRYQWRVISYVYWMREPYPPFDFSASAIDPGGDPATLSIEYPARLSRILIFVKWLLAFPHYLVLLFLGVAAYVGWVVSFFAVLVLGRWPAGLRQFLVGVVRWGTRVQAYVYLLTDTYPPFSLAP